YTQKVNDLSALNEEKKYRRADEVRIEVLKILFDSPNSQMQWRDLRDKIVNEFTNKQHRPKPYPLGSINTTLDRVLKKLCSKSNDGYVNLIEKKGTPKEMYYFI